MQSQIIFFLSFQAPVQRFFFYWALYLYITLSSFCVDPRFHYSGGQE